MNLYVNILVYVSSDLVYNIFPCDVNFIIISALYPAVECSRWPGEGWWCSSVCSRGWGWGWGGALLCVPGEGGILL